LIARPTSFFHLSAAVARQAQDSVGHSNATTPEYDFPTPTSGQRLGAIGVAMLGVCGSAIVFTTIRWIGKRAHPLISVNYFATWCTIVSTIVLTTASHLPAPFTSPDLYFRFPNSFRQWGMLLFLGTCGFIMQFLMTAGMSHERSNRATNMVYTNMLFALLFDRWIFGTVPGMWSLLGSGLILGSAIYVAVQKGVTSKQGVDTEVETGLLPDEERGMLGNAIMGDDSDDEGLQMTEMGSRDDNEERRH
jgi:drug/metabolite transporter (DMT)-like permease